MAKKNDSSRIMRNMSKIMAATMAVSSVVALVPSEVGLADPVVMVDANTPTHGAQSISFTDTDNNTGKIGGTITVTAATYEGDIDDYVVYWADTNGPIGDAVATVTKTGEGSQLTIPLSQNTTIPIGASMLKVFSHNSFGYSQESIVIPLVDNTANITVSNPIADKEVAGFGNIDIPLAEVFTDADITDKLTYSLSYDFSILNSGNTYIDNDQIAHLNYTGLGTTTVTVTATDGHGNYKSTSFQLHVALAQSPAITVGKRDGGYEDRIRIYFAENETWANGVRSSGTITIDGVTLSPGSYNGDVHFGSVGIILDYPLPEGTHTIVVHVDGYEDAVAQLTIGANMAPTVITIPPQVGFVSKGYSLDLGNYFSDQDQDYLTYTVETLNSSVVNASLSGSMLSIEFRNSGTTTITVTANDGHSHSVNTTFSFTADPAAVINNVSIPFEHYTVGDAIVMTVEADHDYYTAGLVNVSLNNHDISNTLHYIGDNQYTFTYTVSNSDADLLAGDIIPYYVKFSKGNSGSDIFNSSNNPISNSELSIEGTVITPRYLYPNNNNSNYQENKNYNLIIDFEAINTEIEPVSGGTISIYRNDNALIATIPVTSDLVKLHISNDGATYYSFYINVSNLLDYEKTYYVKVSKGAFINGAGKKYLGINDTSWSFTTKGESNEVISGNLAKDNSYIDITYGADVYGDSDREGPVTVSQLKLTSVINPQVSGVTNIAISSISKPDGGPLVGGESVIRVYLDIVGTPKGNETIEISSIAPIYTHSGVIDEPVSASIHSETDAPLAEDIEIINEDTVVVNHVNPFSKIKVYDALTGGTLLASEVAGFSEDPEVDKVTVTLSIPGGFASNLHYIYVTQQEDNDDSIESKRTRKAISSVIASSGADTSVDLADGNKTINETNNTWTINVLNATVKADLTAADLIVTDLPDGLTLAAAKGIGNSIKITVTGTIASALTSTTDVQVVVQGSAVAENGATNATSLSLQLHPYTVKPSLVAAVVSGENQIKFVFNEPLINDISFYMDTHPLGGSANSGITINSAYLDPSDPSNKTVILILSQGINDTNYIHISLPAGFVQDTSGHANDPINNWEQAIYNIGIGVANSGSSHIDSETMLILLNNAQIENLNTLFVYEYATEIALYQSPDRLNRISLSRDEIQLAIENVNTSYRNDAMASLAQFVEHGNGFSYDYLTYIGVPVSDVHEQRESLYAAYILSYKGNEFLYTLPFLRQLVNEVNASVNAAVNEVENVQQYGSTSSITYEILQYAVEKPNIVQESRMSSYRIEITSAANGQLATSAQILAMVNRVNLTSGMNASITITGGADIPLGQMQVNVNGLPTGHKLYASAVGPSAVSIPVWMDDLATVSSTFTKEITTSINLISTEADQHISFIEVNDSEEIVGYRDFSISTADIGTMLNADQLAAALVVSEINALPYSASVTLANKDAIIAARTHYNSLTADQKALVGSLAKLTDAEAALPLLPHIVSASVANGNAYVDLLFSTYIVGIVNGNYAALDQGDFDVNFNQNGGTATGVSIVRVENRQYSSPSWRIYLQIEGSANGQETIEIKPHDDQSVFTFTNNIDDRKSYSSYATTGELQLHANVMPTANPSITGDAVVGKTLIAASGFADVDGDQAGANEYQWQSSSDSGVSFTDIANATNSSYLINANDVTRIIRVKVTPKAATGVITGEIVYSNPTGVIISVEASAIAKVEGIALNESALGINAQDLLDAGVDSSNVIEKNLLTYQLAISTAQNGDLNSKAKIQQMVLAVNKSVIDQLAAALVVGEINALPNSASVTLANKDAIIAARTHYNSLTDDQKALVGSLAKLTDAEAVLPLLPHIVSASVGNGNAYVDLLFSTYIVGIVNGNYAALDQGDFDVNFHQNGGTATGVSIVRVENRQYSSPSWRIYLQIEGSANGQETIEIKPHDDQSVFTFTNNIADRKSYSSYATTGELQLHANVMPTANPSITGAAVVGETLIAVSGFADVDGDQVGANEYQWQSSSDSGVSFTDIANATSSSYLIDANDVTRIIRVKVTPKAATGVITGEIVYSNPTVAIIFGTAQPLSNTPIFADAPGAANDGKTIVILGALSSPNTYKYILSQDANPVPIPNVGDTTEGWTSIVSGDLITAVNGKHVGIAEVNADGKVVRFGGGQAVVIATAQPLSNTPIFADAPGAANDGKTIVTLGTLSSPNTYKYILSQDANPVPIPNVGDTTVGWTSIVSGDLITAANGKHIGIAEVDGDGKVVRFGGGQAVVIATAQPLSNTPIFADAPGAANDGKTIVTLGALSSPNTYKYILSQDGNPVPIPNVGDTTVGWISIVSGDLITAANGKHIGIAEVDGDGKVIRFGSGVAVVMLAAPLLTPNTSDAYTVVANKITFSNNATWSGLITQVMDGTTLLKTIDYTIAADSITINPNVLSTKGVHQIKVIASGYEEAIVNQTVNLAENAMNITQTGVVAKDEVVKNSTGILATATISNNEGHFGNEWVVFELFDSSGAKEIQTYMNTNEAGGTFIAHFSGLSVTNTTYQVKVYVLSSYTSPDQRGVELAPVVTLSDISFNTPLDSNKDTKINMDDLIQFMANASLALKDFNHDNVFDHQDIAILLNMISPISE